jgi:glycosyltransferase involved in cell wall biosynthesis
VITQTSGQATPRVSVLVAAYNASAYLLEALDSLLQQTVEDIEIIVVDDGSTDDTARLVGSLADPRVVLLRSDTNRGAGASRNIALEHATAEWVAIMDADDVAERVRLERQLEFVTAHPRVDVLGSAVAVIDSQGAARGWRSYPLDHRSIVRTLPLRSPLAHPTVLCRKSTLLAVGGWHEDRLGVEDYDLWCRLAREGARFANLPQALVRYRVHPQGWKSRGVRASLRGTLLVKHRYWPHGAGPRAGARRAGERLLLLLPPPLVLRLFAIISYRRRGAP